MANGIGKVSSRITKWKLGVIDELVPTQKLSRESPPIPQSTASRSTEQSSISVRRTQRRHTPTIAPSSATPQRRFNVDLDMLYGDTFSQPVRRWEIRLLGIRQITEDGDPIIPLVRMGWRPLMMSR